MEEKIRDISKQELLHRLIKGRVRSSGSHGVVKRDSLLPLSPSQHQIWLMMQLDEKIGSAYHVPTAFSLFGGLNRNALEKTFESIIARHETLRTNIRVTGEYQPYQYINDHVNFSLHIYSALTRDENPKAPSKLQMLFEQLISKPFDLEKDSLIRVGLIERDINHHVLLIVMHHLITDAWSMGILNKEISELYSTLATGQPVSTVPLKFQYADYVVSQQHLLNDETVNREIVYWKETLHNIPLLNLPTDRSRPTTKSYEGASLSFEIESQLYERVRRLSKEYRCTNFMTILAVFVTFLYRHTHQTDICVGTPISNRFGANAADLIGYFVNIIALRSKLDGSQLFEDLLRQIKSSALLAYQNQTTPFEKIVRALNPDRSQAYSSVFQVMMVFRSNGGGGIKIPGLEVKYERIDTTTALFDLTLIFDELSDGRVLGSFEYATDLFDEATVAHFKNRFLELINSVCDNPKMPLDQLNLIPASEKKKIVLEWNNTNLPFPSEKCIHELIEERAAEIPDSVAVIFENSQLTYGELNSQANQFAHYLHYERGVGPDVLVGICMDRCSEMIIVILAILKAGGAYVPLDSNYPTSRLEQIINECDLNTVVTQRHLQGRIPTNDSVNVYVDEMRRVDYRESKNIPPNSIALNSSNLAYVIFTSGSTGKPKGVMIEHKSTTALSFWANATYNSTDRAFVLAATSISFDLSVFEIICTLQSGGVVVLSKNIFDLPFLLHREKITMINTVPSVAEQLIKMGAIPKNLRAINLAGEPLRQATVDLLYEIGVSSVFDLYGPTEDTTYSTFALRGYRASPTIGRPIFNTQAYIFDHVMNLSPIGVVGELYLGGNGLSRGYLNQPELTHEKFVPNPFDISSNASGSKRIYKTGDLCRYSNDGCLEYIGRIDNQVKVRGLRIELGEVEEVLARHISVAEVAVVVQSNLGTDKRIVAFYVTRSEVPRDELESFLRVRLPEYMIPEMYVKLEKIPLTSNGKVDRKKLELAQVDLELRENFESPTTIVEIKLAKVWAEILEVDISSIGLQTNFFKVGGHSLSVMFLLMHLRDKFNVTCGPAEIYKHRSLLAQSKLIESLSSEIYENSEVKNNFCKNGNE